VASLFKRTHVNYGGAFHAERGLIVAGSTLTGTLLQNLNVAFAQMVNRIYEIGTAGQNTNMYYVGGRAQGNIGTAYIVGPPSAMADFYDTFGDVCNALNNKVIVNLSANLCAAGGVAIGASPKYTANLCVLTQIGMTVGANDFLITVSGSVMFSGMEYNE
jgi:hypothetical protein